jgi:pimeloyl-ACP methyl ester carboxylesterase
MLARPLRPGLALALLLIVAPAAAQQRSVDVGGRSLDVFTGGGGVPTVVFESGLGADRRAWDAVLPLVGSAATVVTYSRAGLGASDPAGDARSFSALVEDLHAMLLASGVPPPYVLVGHSMGGILVRMFAAAHPDLVAGLVLVDDSHEHQHALLRQADPAAFERVVQGEEGSVAGRSAAARAEWAAFRASTGTFDTPSPVLPDVPVAVLTSVRDVPPAHREGWSLLHATWLARMSNGLHLVTSRAGHGLPREAPAMIAHAIHYVLDEVRAGGTGR